MLTGTFYTVPCTGLSLRISLVPDVAVRFLVFLYRYVCIVISGCIQIDQFRVSVIFIFGSGPTEVFSRIILFAGEINSHFIVRRIPSSGICAERNFWIGGFHFLTCQCHKISNVFRSPFHPFLEILSRLCDKLSIRILLPNKNIFGELRHFLTYICFKLFT